MTDNSVDVAVVASDDKTSYMDWPAIIAGIVVAAAISILLLTFGAAVGLSFTSFEPGEGVSPVWLAIAAGIWLIWVQVSSFMAGGYLTGRMRRRHGDATEHEVDVRDGMHGFVMWGGALLLGVLIASSGLGSAVNMIGAAASTATSAAADVAGSVAEDQDPTAYFVDTLFRPATTTEAAAEAPAAEAPEPTADPVATTPTITSPVRPAAPVTVTTVEVSDAARAEAGRILARNAVSGEWPDEDRARLVQLVAAETAMTEEEAAARVDQVQANVETVRTEAEDAAETARITGVLAAFLTAAALLVSAIGAYWAAQKGGQHRDNGTVFAEMFRRF
ncbi:MAG TPA: hypothetical protein VGN80_15250 [Devosiaceae bacterium]|jgi:hypothetical protein|nr:hypothetical protein [Devosiaceae bacterium]